MKTKRSKTITLDSCQFPFADGRQCRMLRHKDHPSLCLFHAREEQQLLESPRLGAEISATLSDSFFYATDINHVLGKVFTAFAQRRISQRDAATMAYLGQLLCVFRDSGPRLSPIVKPLRINTSMTSRISIKTNNFNYRIINTYKSAQPLLKTNDFKSSTINTYTSFRCKPFRIRTSKKEGGGGRSGISKHLRPASQQWPAALDNFNR